jgi:hypothetical protein
VCGKSDRVTYIRFADYSVMVMPKKLGFTGYSRTRLGGREHHLSPFVGGFFESCS